MPYIVVSRDRGAATRPVLHALKETAMREARRLAEAHEGDEFTVYASITTVRLRRFEEVDASPADLLVDDVPF